MRDHVYCRPGWLIALILTVFPARGAEVTDDQVRQAIEGAVRFLKGQQRPGGDYSEGFGAFVPGVTSLVTLALINAGEPVSSPVIQKALTHLRGLPLPTNTYGNSLQTMVFCAAEPNKDRALIVRNVEWLEKTQLRSGPRVGAWGYGKSNGDNSNAQFAILALHEAERVGVKVDPTVWKTAAEYWLRTQLPDGSWSYTGSEPPTGSMTCAGVASLMICLGRITGGDAVVQGEAIHCCGEQADHQGIERGLRWLGDTFDSTRNPGDARIDSNYWLYYLYGVERVGRMSGRRFLGQHDWFREGAETLVALQDKLGKSWQGEGHAEGNRVVATSLALLFLSKGRRPVVMSKVQFADGMDWNHHRAAVQNLTSRVEQRWKRDLTWQTIDLRVASAEDLSQSPVLFLSGRDGLPINEEQEARLKTYIERGGFVFAEACCSGGNFDRDFRELMKRLFPDSPLRLLPPDHPVWFAEQKVDPKQMRPLYGIDACCRTSVVYSPQDLSCLWELSPGARESPYPAIVTEQIEAAMRTGANVLTYATNRELRNKLDQPLGLAAGQVESLPRGTLQVPKIMHGGGSDEAANAIPNLLAFVRQQAELRAVVENRLLAPTDPTLFEYPIAYLHGRRAFRFSPVERQALATFAERGGVLLADSICASPEFTESFRQEMSAIFPGHELERISPDHPLFSNQFRGFDLRQVTIRDPQLRTEGDPLLANLTKISPVVEGISIDDRLVVLFSPYDLSCALENGASLQCKGYIKEDAARLGTNLILYSLQQ